MNTHQLKPFSSPEEIKEYILLYANNPVFQDAKNWLILDNPYYRPLRTQDLKNANFCKPLKKENVLSSSALAAQRVLFNIYESDLVFLPEKKFTDFRTDFEEFYSNETKLLGELVRPTLEAHVFSFLNEEINISGEWSLKTFKLYFQDLLKEHEQSESSVAKVILSSREPRKAAILLLIQSAGDFLSEASAMARNILGNYSWHQSELFKILIDEYGYGVHKTKHSTLFEKTLISCELMPQIHTYWQFYLTSSLALYNYFHYVSRDHSKLFRYFGALLYTEATLVHTCQQLSKMLRTIFGSSVDTQYFDEHVHIDRHHGRMVFDNLIEPLVSQYGNSIIEEMVRGVEEFRLLTDIADTDLIAQIAWFDQSETHKELAKIIYNKICTGQIECPHAMFVEPQHELSTTHVHDSQELFVVEFGEIELVNGHNQIINLKAGEGIIIPQNRLHGSMVVSDECIYHVYSIEDYPNLLD